MDTNVIIAIVVAVVVIAAIIIGAWWFGKASKRSVERATDEAVAKGVQLATEDTEHAGNADADHTQHAEVSAASAEVAGTAAVKAQKPSVSAVASAAEEPPVAKTVVETPEAAGTRMQRLKARLSKSGNPFGRALFNILAKDQLSESDWEDVEDTLLLADVGAEASEQLVEELRVGTDTDRRLNADKEGANKPSVIIMVGVNGTGKTTTAGKLSRLLVSEGKQVMLGAADTFRAAAADQLETWGAKVGVPVVRSDKDGADPASVAFEASAKAKEANADVLIIDTAGRLQNKSNLMDELGKIRRVTEKNLPVDEVLLVLDATTGQNGMTQAKVFAEAIGITGVVLSKLDGSAKGGIVISVQKELGVPVKLVGLGEGPDDLAPFDPEGFVDGILA